MLKSEVWDRTDDTGNLSKATYSSLLGLFVAAGIAVCAAFSLISRNWVIANGWVVLGFCLAVLASAITGIIVANKSDSPAISGIGYLLVAGPFGLLLGPVVAQYTTTSVLRVLLLTVLLAGILGIIGAVTPKDLSSWANYLLGGLVLLFVGFVGVPFLGAFGVPIGGAMTAMDWIGIVLFGAFVIFEMNRAMRIAYTVDNAVDAALAVFLDMLNIFIRMLSLFGIRI